MSEPAVIYGSAALRAKGKADLEVAEEIARRLATMRTPGVRGKFTLVLEDGRILSVVMESRVEVRMP